MNPIELGRRLRAVRDICGISQQAVAEVVGVPRTAITQMEAGNRSVSTLELSKMAALYQRPVSFFLNEEEATEEDLLIALHRVVPGLEQVPNVRAQVDRCVSLCRDGVVLQKLLGHDEHVGPPTYAVGVPRTFGEAIAQGERIANEERRRLGIGNAPITDVSELIGSQGVWASGTELPNEMSGLFLCHSSIGLAILVNAVHPRGRKRFSYAHEFAHALMDRERQINISSTSNSADLVEKRANAFAAAFLMPRGGMAEILQSLDKGQPSRQEQTIFDAASGGSIEAEYRPPARSQRINYKDVALIAHHFGVSYQAAVYRLKSLRHVSQTDTEALLGHEDFGRQYLVALNMFAEVGEQEQEQNWNRELRSEIAHLAIEAYRRAEISRGRLLELSNKLDINGQLLLELAEVARGD